MRFVCWIITTADTYLEYVIPIAFHGNIGYANALQCSVSTYIACLFDFRFRPYVHEVRTVLYLHCLLVCEAKTSPIPLGSHYKPRAFNSPNILFARISVLILFTTPNTCDITHTHTHVKQVTPTEVHTIVATDCSITLSYDTFVALCNIGVSVRAPAVIVVCWDRVASLPTPQSGQVADSSGPLRPGPPTGSCERFHGLSESLWVNDISIVLLPLRFGTGVSEIRSDLVSITDSSVDKVADYVRAVRVRPAVDFRHGH